MAGGVAGWAAARSAGANVRLEQFIPNWNRQREQQSAEQMIAFMRGVQHRKRKAR